VSTPDDALEREYVAALQRLAKWRAAYAGWQLGTRANTDPEAQAVRDSRELLLILRAEVNALTALLVRAGLFGRDDFLRQIIEECDHLQRLQEQKFPGFTATEHGLTIDTHRAVETMKGWRP
jgi:hypothetical protein